MELAVFPVEPARRDDFFSLQESIGCRDCCYCVAWWVPTWRDWDDRTGEQNRALRESLFDRGEYDGFLAYRDGVPVGWSQVGPRDRLEKLRHAYGLEPDPGAWAVSCFLIRPDARGTGVARTLLSHALDDLRGSGIGRVEAFPFRAEGAEEVWTGPEALFRSAGFACEREHPRGPVYVKRLED